MGKKTYFINGNYYIVDDETGSIKRVIIQDDAAVPQKDMNELIKAIIADERKNQAES